MENSKKWLHLIRQVEAISQTGLTYGEGGFDLERYEQLRELSMQMYHLLSNYPPEKIPDLFPVIPGYHTPKVDIRAVVMKEGKVLMVKEKADQKWALPGGWADVGYSPTEVAEKEVGEEAGIQVKANRLLGLVDKKCHDHPPFAYYTYKCFIACEYVMGNIETGPETLDVNFFPVDQLPELSTERNTEAQILSMVERYVDPSLPVWLD